MMPGNRESPPSVPLKDKEHEPYHIHKRDASLPEPTLEQLRKQERRTLLGGPLPDYAVGGGPSYLGPAHLVRFPWLKPPDKTYRKEVYDTINNYEGQPPLSDIDEVSNADIRPASSNTASGLHPTPPRGHSRKPSSGVVRPESPTLGYINEEHRFPSPEETAYQGAGNGGYRPISQPVGKFRPRSAPLKLWKSFWLSKWTLLSLGVFSLSLMVALLLLRLYSRRDHGFKISSNAEQYAWTYVPTLIMLIVVALWRQVDCNCKQLMPWHELRNGPTSPKASLLADYVSSFQIVSFFAAFKRLHIPVIVTICAFFITKLLAIASTGLFELQLTNLTETIPTSALPQFNSASLLPSLPSSLEALSIDSMYRYYTYVANGVPLSPGVTSELVYVPLDFNGSSVPTSSKFSYSAETSAFVTDITCTVANVTIDSAFSFTQTNLSYNSTLRPFGNGRFQLTLPQTEACDEWKNVTINAIDPTRYRSPNEQIEGTTQEVFCAGQTQPSGLLYTLTDIRYTQRLLTNTSRPEGGLLPIALNTSRTLARMVNVLCQPSYRMTQVNISGVSGTPEGTVTELPNAINGTINGFMSSNLTSIFREAVMGSASDLFPRTINQSRTAQQLWSASFDLLAVTAGSSDYAPFFDSSNLLDAAQKAFKGVITQYVAQTLKSPASIQESGNTGPTATISWSEQRLFTNQPPLYFMVGALGVLAILSAFLVSVVPQGVVPQDPSSLAATATVLARSPELNRLLRKQHVPRNENVAAVLNGYNVGTAIATTESGSSSFKIHLTKGGTDPEIGGVQKDLRWWKPITASIFLLILIVLLFAGAIAGLQILQQKSDNDKGLLDVKNEDLVFYASHFLPALITILLASTVNVLDFNISLFSPWFALARGNAPASSTILLSLIGSSPPIAFLKALRTKHFGACLSMIATLSAILLTVFAADLFSIVSINLPGPSQGLNRLDTWDFVSSYSVSDDGGAAAVLDLLEYSGASYPEFTYDEFAFPKMSLGSFEPQLNTLPTMNFTGSTLGTIPALRGNLRCNPLTVFNVDIENGADSVAVTAEYDLPLSCQNSTFGLNQTRANLKASFTPSGNDYEFGGKLFDLRFGTNASLYGNTGERQADLVGNNPPAGCPSLGFVFGNFSVKQNDKNLITVAVCYQEIQELNVNVTFQQGSLTVDPIRPPVPNEDSVIIIQTPNGTADVKSFDFRIQKNLARELGNVANMTNSSSIPDNLNADAFFQALLYGQNGTNVASLIGSANISPAMSAINRLYRRYMAQVYNVMLRESVSDGQSALKLRQDPSTFTELQTTIVKSRLVQNRTSKLAMQVLLAVAIVFVTAGYFTTGLYHRLLPCNPCSIAGAMSLLAGSDLCWTPQESICDCCGKLRRNSFGDDVQSSIHAASNEDVGADERPQIITYGTEWMDKADFTRVFEYYFYALRWWSEDRSKGRRKRLGVDVTTRPNGNGDDDWYLGKIKTNTSQITLKNYIGAAVSRGLGSNKYRNGYHRAQAVVPAGEEDEISAVLPQERPVGYGGHGHERSFFKDR